MSRITITQALDEAQEYLHRVGPKSGEYQRFEKIMSHWALHPRGREWSLVDDLVDFVKYGER